MIKKETEQVSEYLPTASSNGIRHTEGVLDASVLNILDYLIISHLIFLSILSVRK